MVVNDAHPVTLTVLLDMIRQAVRTDTAAELEYMAVNASHALAPYRQAALWTSEQGVVALSGIVQREANAPYTQWLAGLCHAQISPVPTRVEAADVAPEFAGQWQDWAPPCGLWLPWASPSQGRGGVLLLRDLPWMDDEVELLAEWINVWQHAYRAKLSASGWSLRALRERLFPAPGAGAPRPWYRRPPIVAGLAVAGLLLCPVRLSVLAPGELVAADAAVVRSPLEGIIERFHIRPNQSVKAGQPLFDFDQAQLAARAAVVQQALATAEAEYRQSAQQALIDAKAKSQLATLQGKIEERRTEAQFLAGQVARATVVAPRDGVVLFDDPSEWQGRPVGPGERILRVADPQKVEVEAWLPIADAIPFGDRADATLYLSASPLDPVPASLRYVAFDASQRPDGSYAYRVRANVAGSTAHRIGLKGTVRLSSGWVPLGYWVFRRPWSLIRQTLGV